MWQLLKPDALLLALTVAAVAASAAASLYLPLAIGATFDAVGASAAGGGAAATAEYTSAVTALFITLAAAAATNAANFALAGLISQRAAQRCAGQPGGHGVGARCTQGRGAQGACGDVPGCWSTAHCQSMPHALHPRGERK